MPSCPLKNPPLLAACCMFTIVLLVARRSHYCCCHCLSCTHRARYTTSTAALFSEFTVRQRTHRTTSRFDRAPRALVHLFCQKHRSGCRKRETPVSLLLLLLLLLLHCCCCGVGCHVCYQLYLCYQLFASSCSCCTVPAASFARERGGILLWKKGNARRRHTCHSRCNIQGTSPYKREREGLCSALQQVPGSKQSTEAEAEAAAAAAAQTANSCCAVWQRSTGYMRAIRASASTAPPPFAHRLTATLLLFCARAAHPAEAFATQQPKAILTRALVAVHSPKILRRVSPKTLVLRASPWVHLVRSTSTAIRSTRTVAVRPPSTTAAAAMRKTDQNDGDGGLKLGSGGGGGGVDDDSAGGDGGSGSTSLSLPAFLETSSARGRTQANSGGGSCSGGSDGNTNSSSSNVVFHAFSGNEACDADSICSAICMAFLKQSTASGGGAEGGGGQSGDGGSDDDVATKGGDGTNVLYVPVMPIPRADLALRREVLVLLDLCGVNPSSLLFCDDIDLPSLHAEGRLRLTLMDHNAVSGNLTGLGDAVVEIVDHHIDLGEHTRVRGASRDIAFDAAEGNGKALVGSCCTLVAERMLAHAPRSLTSEVARLLLGVVLIDTINLDVSAKRATLRDVAVVEELSRRVSWQEPPTRPSAAAEQGSADPSAGRPAGRSGDRSTAIASTEEKADPNLSPSALFDALRNAKFDPAFWTDLSATDCLRYDYKQFSPPSAGSTNTNTNSTKEREERQQQQQQQQQRVPLPPPAPLKFGMSSVLCKVSTLADKPGVADAMRDFSLARGLDSLLVMASTINPHHHGKMEKEILVFAGTEQRRDQMQEFFEGPSGEFMRLQRVEVATSLGGGGCNRDGGGGGGGGEGSGDAGGGGGRDGGEGGGGIGGGGARLFLQWTLGNVAPSRKQVAPMVASFYESLVRCDDDE